MNDRVHNYAVFSTVIDVFKSNQIGVVLNKSRALVLTCCFIFCMASTYSLLAEYDQACLDKCYLDYSKEMLAASTAYGIAAVLCAALLVGYPLCLAAASATYVAATGIATAMYLICKEGCKTPE